MRHIVCACALVGVLFISIASAEDLNGGPNTGVYTGAMARANEAGTLILFVYNMQTTCPLSNGAEQCLTRTGRGAVTAGMIVQSVPIRDNDRRYSAYRGQFRGNSVPFWVLTKPDGEYLAGGEYDTVKVDGTGGWKETVARYASEFPPIGPRQQEQIAEVLEQAQADLEAGRLGDVQPLLGRLGMVWHPSELADQCDTLRNDYNDAVEELTDRPEQLLDDEQFLQAALAYERVIKAFEGQGDEVRAARDAQRRVLSEHPEIRAAFNEQRHQVSISPAPEATDDDPPEPVEAAADDQAPPEGPAVEAPPEPEAPDAATLERRAASLVNMARMYRGRDMVDKAKVKLQECIDTYPDTEAAQQARQLLTQW